MSTLRRTADHLESFARTRRQESMNRAVARALPGRPADTRTYDLLSAAHR